MTAATSLHSHPHSRSSPPIRAAVPDVLLSLAWLGRISSAHVQAVAMAHYSPKLVSKLLVALCDDGLVERTFWYDESTVPGSPPVRRSAWWSLTKAGWAQIAALEAAPVRWQPARSVYWFAHDRMMTETVVRLILLAQGDGLSGVYVEREVRVDPHLEKPIMDAVVRLHMGGDVVMCGTVPWLRGVPLGAERTRVYAVEADGDTERRTILHEKALAYARANTPEWEHRHGMRFPIPLWVAPTDARRDQIMDIWSQAWPGGRWWAGSLAGAAHDTWVRYDRGMRETRPLFGEKGRHVTP